MTDFANTMRATDKTIPFASTYRREPIRRKSSSGMKVRELLAGLRRKILLNGSLRRRALFR